jgi:hypothetical protein
MGFRFSKSFKIAPGVKLNLSKSGLSTSIGRRGASVNIGKRGVRSTVGIPGTGLSYSSSSSSSRRSVAYGKKASTATATQVVVVNKDKVLEGIKNKPGDKFRTASYFCIPAILVSAVLPLTPPIPVILALLSIVGLVTLLLMAKSKDEDFRLKLQIEKFVSLYDELMSMCKTEADHELTKDLITPQIFANTASVEPLKGQYIIDRGEWRLHLARKYGFAISHALFNHEYFIGMTLEQLLEIKGEPEKTEAATTAKGEKKTFIYGSSKQRSDWFVLENDVVVKFVKK